MAMATQASLFTPPFSGLKPSDRASVPWKQSPTFSFTSPKPLKLSKTIRAAADETAEAATKEAPVGFTPPELDPNTPSPIFGGSTGGLLRKAQVEEFYVITWESPARFAAHELSPLFSRGDSGLFRLLDDYANVMASRAGPSFTNSMRTFQPRFDMKESKDAYELHGELPGIAQKDINIEFTDPTTLSIRGRTESVREEGRRPTSIESPAEQQKLTDAAETESVASSTNYHKASVEDEATASGANPDATPAETSAASEAPAAQSQEVAQAQQDDAPNYWFSERSVGSFARSFSFPQRVDQEAVKASLKDGILSIVVPKAPAPALRKIDIE